MSEQSPQRLDIDWLKTFAGALAAVTSAVLLSTLGAAGTLIGAAVGSIAATVGTALYNQGLARGRARVAQVAKLTDTARLRVGSSPAPIADELAVPEETAAEEPVPGWRQRLGGLPWKRVAAVAAGTFVAVVAVLSLFELASGRAVSTLTGGSDGSGSTTIGRVTGGSSGSDSQQDQDQDQQRPGDGATPSDDPSSSADPSDEPSTDPSSTPTDDPSTTPSETPSDTPSEEPTAPATPSPTAPATPAPTTPPVVEPAPSATTGPTPSA